MFLEIVEWTLVVVFLSLFFKKIFIHIHNTRLCLHVYCGISFLSSIFISLSLFFVCQCPYACLPFSSSFTVDVGVWTVIWKDVRDLLVAATRSMGKNRKGGISILCYLKRVSLPLSPTRSQAGEAVIVERERNYCFALTLLSKPCCINIRFWISGTLFCLSTTR